MAVYQLPKAAKPAQEPMKPVKGSPDSLYYMVIRAASGNFQVVTKDGGICQYQSPQKDWAIAWVLENDLRVA